MAGPRSSRGATWARHLLAAIAVAIAVYLLWSIWDHDAVMRWMERARPAPFFIAMALLPAAGLPFTPLYLLAGATFDLRLAVIGTVLALAVNLALCYVVGRSSLRPRLGSLFERFGYRLPDFEAEAEAGRSVRRAVRFTTLVKLAPGVPGFVKHYGLGAARVPFGVYFAVGMVISAGYALTLIILGDSLFDHQLGRGAIAIVVAIGLALVVRWWIHRHAPVRAPRGGTA